MGQDDDPGALLPTLDASIEGGDEGLGSGDMLGRYEVIRRLGRGGMGEVWLARDAGLGRLVALKVIRPDRLSDATSTELFLKEARTTARFNDPHVVAIHDIGTHGDTPWIALEYVEGGSLRDRLAAGPLPEREVARLGAAIARVLDAAHAQGIVHRDLKPGNVLLPPDGRLRVADFGLASAVRLDPSAPSDDVTATQGAAGTPAYMAPEQWRHQPCAASDIWALGVLLWECVAGRRPFEPWEGRPFELFGRVYLGEPAPPLEAGSPDFAALVARCLRQDPAARPTAGEVARALEAAARPLPGRDGRSPYPGLLPFDETLADLFCGREDACEAARARLREQVVLPILGPSGAGKSSLVRAGLLPRLREGGAWQVVDVRPGPSPLRSLAGRVGLALSGASTPDGPRLLPADDLEPRLRETPGLLSTLLLQLSAARATSVLLVVDQLEEAVTLAEPDDARVFLEAVSLAAVDRSDDVRAVWTARDDFVSRLAGAGPIRAALERPFLLGAPSEAALAEIVEAPATAAGFRFDDPELPLRMAAEVVGRPAPLPLLQAACTRLWDRRDVSGKRLKAEAYAAMGGVLGALGAHGEDVLEGLDAASHDRARQILLRLVTDDDTRRVVPRAELLSGLDAGAAAMVDRLTAARLLVQRADSGEPRVELAHEALVDGWPRLRTWLDEGREGLVALREVEAAASAWEARTRPDELLWTGAALSEARVGVQAAGLGLSEAGRAFLERGEERDRAAAQGRRRRRVAAGIAIVVAAASVFAAYEQIRTRSLEASASAVAEEVAVYTARAAESARGDRHSEAVAFARAAIALLPDAPGISRADAQLLRELAGGGLMRVYEAGGPLHDWSPSPDGESFVVVLSTGASRRLRRSDFQPLGPGPTCGEGVLPHVTGHDAASRPWLGCPGGRLVGLDAERRCGDATVTGLVARTDGTLLVVGADGALCLFDADGVRATAELGRGVHSAVPNATGSRAALLPYTIEPDGRAVTVVDTASLSVVSTFSGPPGNKLRGAHFDPHGEGMAFRYQDLGVAPGRIVVGDPDTGEVLRSYAGGPNISTPVLDQRGRRLTFDTTEMRVVDPRADRELGTWPIGGRPSTPTAVSDHRLAGVEWDGILRAVDFPGAFHVFTESGLGGQPDVPNPARDGELAVAVPGVGRLAFVDLAGLPYGRRARTPETIYSAAPITAGDGAYFGGSTEGTLHRFELGADAPAWSVALPAPGLVHWVDASPGGELAAAASRMQGWTLVRGDTGEVIRAEAYPGVLFTGFDATGERLIVTTDTSAQVLDAATGAPLGELPAGGLPLVGRDGDVYLVERLPEALQRCDLDGLTCREVARCEEPTRQGWEGGGVGADGAILFGCDGGIGIYDPERDEQRRFGDSPVLGVRAASLFAVASSPSGRLVATGGGDGVVEVFDARTGARTARLESGVRAVADLRFLDERTLASLHADEHLAMLDVPSGLPIARHRVESGGGGRILDDPRTGGFLVGGTHGSLAALRLDLPSPRAFELAGEATNLRVCRRTREVVAVVPHPAADSAWAPEEACGAPVDVSGRSTGS